MGCRPSKSKSPGGVGYAVPGDSGNGAREQPEEARQRRQPNSPTKQQRNERSQGQGHGGGGKTTEDAALCARVITHEDMKLHRGPKHVERPARLEAIQESLLGHQLWHHIIEQLAAPASNEQLLVSGSWLMTLDPTTPLPRCFVLWYAVL